MELVIYQGSRVDQNVAGVRHGEEEVRRAWRVDERGAVAEMGVGGDEFALSVCAYDHDGRQGWESPCIVVEDVVG